MPGRFGQALTVRAVQLRVEHWAQEAGLGFKASPHWLRHSRAMDILRTSTAKNPLQIVQSVLAHASLNSTAIYAGPSREEIEATLEALDGKAGRTTSAAAPRLSATEGRVMHSHKPSEKSMAQFVAQVQAQESRLHAERAEGVPALHRLLNVARGHTGQSRVIARFLLGLYNGTRFKVDLTDFRLLTRNCLTTAWRCCAWTPGQSERCTSTSRMAGRFGSNWPRIGM